MKWVKVAIGAVIAVSVVPVIVNSIADLTGTGGSLENTVSGTLLDLAPLVFVAGILGYLFLSTGSNAD
jgi:hypothetical protein